MSHSGYEPYPRSLYRKAEDGPPENNFDGVQCQILTVESEEEEEDAKALGYHNSPAEAGGAPKAALAKKDKAPKVDDPRKALRAEYQALAGKKPFTGWSADQLSEKIAALKAA